MTDTNPGGWPDAARELVEWALAVHFSGNRMPHMSGDPRNRLAPGQRRAMEDARDAVLEALAPILAAQIEAARREEREICKKLVLTMRDAWRKRHGQREGVAYAEAIAVIIGARNEV
jgi:hypothetical protein